MSTMKRTLFFAIALLASCAVEAKIAIKQSDDVTVSLSGKFSNSTDLHNNSSLLNSVPVGARGEKVDFAFLNRSKFELTTNLKHAKGLEAQATMRSKFTWGTPKISTASSSIKYGEALLGSHSHDIERNHIYMQEAWLKMDLDTLCGLNLWKQSVTVGLFPFALGKGISLGDSYAVDPSSLGFYSDSSVDQYAPGLKLSGDLYWDQLKYDLYWSVMQNKTAKLKYTGDQIYDQIIIDGKYVANNKYARGSGDLDWRLATRLKWTPIDDKEKEVKVYFEPYAMYSRDPSQKLEFTADASSKLGTFGTYGEFQYGPVEFSFEGAFNRGNQEVFAWDRNKVIVKAQTDGSAKFVWSHVRDGSASGDRTVADGTTTYRPESGISSAMNGQALASDATKFNASDRFRDAYRVNYKGIMFVADASLYIYKRDLKAAIAGGYSRGDTAPSGRTGARAGDVRNYKGFITQQELYAGDRVKSVFVMGPASSLSRPKPLEAADAFSTGIEGFSNITFVGMGLTYAPEGWSRKFEVKPNIITYWQNSSSKKYDVDAGAYSTTENASNHLGTEVNTCGKVTLVEGLKLSGSVALFLPGKHYTDIKGAPLSAETAALVENAQAGVPETLPTIGNSTAFTMTAGLEYSF